MINNDPDTIRILITTDNHVGYNEMDPIRGNDAARTFREAMMVAKDQEVDMILQGGDLFHINKPTRKSMYEVITAIRMACYGDKPCELELMNQVDLGLEEEFNHVNYEDPNINVAIPFFGISGNHDDAAGDSLLSPMDVLAATGLINHFGRVTENDNITISPILLRKGSTKLALYGMANVRDERLFRTFREGQVKFLRPGTDEGEWFNLMAVHQNHVAHTETSYLPESFLPDFLNFILWGHEHDCIIDPTKNPDSGFHVFQPGSSVATSLSEGEAIPKYIAILSIKGTEFSLEKIRLKTVRPFVMRSVSLLEDSGITPHSTEKSEVTKWLIKQVDALIVTAKKEWVSVQDTPVADEDIPLPLIRLKVEYSGGFEVENPRRFSNRFVGQVANVNDVVQFHKRRVTGQHGTRTIRLGEVNTDSLISDSVTLDKLKVQSLVEEYLKESTLELLPENGLGDAISNFVDKDDRQAVKSFVDGSLDIQVSSLLKLGDIDENTLVKAMKKAKIDLSLESEKRPITKLNSVVSVTTSTVSQNVPKSTTSTVSNRSMAARNNTRTSTRGKQRSNEEFGQLIGVLDTIVDESESLDTSSVQDPATKRNTTSTRRRAAKSTVPAAPKPKTTRVRESTKTTAASTKRNTRAKPVSYAEDMDEIDDAEDFQDSGEDDDFEIASEDEEVPSSSVPRLTRRTAPPISNSSSGKTPSPVEEPPKPKSSRIPWQTSTPPASKTPGRKPRATKSSKTGEAPAPTATRASRSRKPAAPQPSEQLRSSMFKLVGSTQNDPMDIDEDDGFN